MTDTIPDHRAAADAFQKSSYAQWAMMRDLWRAYLVQKERESMPDATAADQIADTFGVRFHVGGAGSVRASASRTLARLEARGLVLRQNTRSGSPGLAGSRTTTRDPAPLRCTHVSFTPLGRAVASLLSPGWGSTDC